MPDKPPKLGLPGLKAKAPVAPADQPGFSDEIGAVILAAIERVGRDRNAVFGTAMAGVLRDEEQFRRLAGALLHRALRKRIKKMLHRLSLADQAKQNSGSEVT